MLEMIEELAPDEPRNRTYLPVYRAQLALGLGRPLEALELMRPEFDKYMAAGDFANPGPAAQTLSTVLLDALSALDEEEELAAVKAALADARVE